MAGAALTMDAIVSWAKRRGFVWAGSELYGSIGAGFDYGPLGAALKHNVTRAWWRDFVERRRDCMPLETSLILNPRVWEASGHVAQFVDPLSVCATCKRRVRADKAVGEALQQHQQQQEQRGAGAGAGAARPLPEWLRGVRDAGVLPLAELGRALEELQVACPACGAVGAAGRGLGEPRSFNLLFQTSVGPLEPGAGGTVAHLRPETAQGAYVQFANIVNASRRRLPFGVGQVGKSFRNEIATGNFLFRTREFDQAELQYFCHPAAAAAAFDEWTAASRAWLRDVAGLREASMRAHVYAPGELAHYARATTDVLFHFPFGWEELMGVANRGDFDLLAHSKASGMALKYRDPVTNEVRGRRRRRKRSPSPPPPAPLLFHLTQCARPLPLPQVCTPCVIEPALGLNRLLLAMFCDGLREEPVPGGEPRLVFRCAEALAPVAALVLPLTNKDSQPADAEALFAALLPHARVALDGAGSIGKRYRRGDEEGTPLCVTVDGATKADGAVTLRDRDSMAQVRVPVQEVVAKAQQGLLLPSTWFGKRAQA